MTRKLGEYLLQEKIYESDHSEVYRVLREADRQPYVVKVLKSNHPTYQEIIRYQQEYETVCQLNLKGIIRAYGIESNRNTLMIVLEDFGASSLQALMQSDSLFPETDPNTDPKADPETNLETDSKASPKIATARLLYFLKLAIAITDALGQLHAAQIIHKDINPANIVFNPETWQVKLIDFGISTTLNPDLSKENQTLNHPDLNHPELIEGTIPYISPEQTGRMNRSVDYRTDFYSLGATFYELLTGQPPFGLPSDTQSAMELIHCHIAKQPVPPDQTRLKTINQQERTSAPTPLPPTISRIVMKLLSKNAKERYQSTSGLKADLEKCYQQLETTGDISDFSLGTDDISSKFKIPQKLYGRDREIKRLLSSFEQVAHPAENAKSTIKSEIMLITGPPGIGKSALVQELQKKTAARDGHFLTGKFDQFQHSIPYSALSTAIQSLIGQLLNSPPRQLEQWRKRLLTALQPNAQVIIDIIPDIELIIGKQPACATLGTIETQNRFNRVFLQFIQIFCQPGKPLVIFLDDLHWIDAATLKLLEAITTQKLKHFFLIGAYRSNEVSKNHPLIKLLSTLKSQQRTVNHIALKPLSLGQIKQILAATLNTQPQSTSSLAQLIKRKTGGNPFFVDQILKSLYQKQLIIFNGQKANSKEALWQWDIKQIESTDIPENVVDLMVETIRKLSPQTQTLLRLASCIGADFDLKTLEIISERSSTAVLSELLPAIEIGLVLPLEGTDSAQLIQRYKFSHDRIQQAAHTAIDQQTLKSTHLKIGKLLRENLAKSDQADRLFEIVDHLNMGQTLIAVYSERLELAELNLDAGHKAKASTAYAAALSYFSNGTQLLSQTSWEKDYSLTFALYIALAEVCHLEGNLDRAQHLITVLLDKHQSIEDQATAYSLLILIHTLQADYSEAISVGRTALQELGVEIPTNHLPEKLTHELSTAEDHWRSQEIASLAHQTEANNPKHVSIIQILMQLLVPAYLTDQELFAFLSAKSANLSFRYGPTPESVLGYSCYGTVLSRAGDYPSGYEFALMSLALTKRFGDLKNRAKACNLLADHAAHWVRPLASLTALHDEGYEAALISGDLQFASYLLHAKVVCAFAMGKNLEIVLEQCNRYLIFAQETQNVLSANTLTAYRFAILNLQGKTENAQSFHDQSFHDSDRCESSFVEQMYANDDHFSSCFFHILRLQIAYLYGNFSMALECANLAKQFLPAIKNFYQEAELNFYESLSLIATCQQASLKENSPKNSQENSRVNTKKQQLYRDKLTANLNQLSTWADHCPENFLHKYLLIKAELANLDNHGMEAIALYDQAITAAQDSQFIQAEALGNELAAKFWLAHGKHEFARLHLARARNGYQQWGALRKVAHLSRTYAKWFNLPTSETTYSETTYQDRQNKNRQNTTSNTSISAPTNSAQALKSLDLQSILSASQALSEALLLETLLTKLINIAIENAGAQKGLLLREKDGQWVIEASGHIEQQEVHIQPSRPSNNTATQQSTQQLVQQPAQQSTQQPARQPAWPHTVIEHVARSLENVVLDNAFQDKNYHQDAYIAHYQIKSLLCIPLLLQGNLSGILYLENNLLEGVFTADRIEVLKLLSTQAAISLRNARLYIALQANEQHLAQSNQELAAKNTALENAKNDLANYSQTLEQRVKRRTAELTQANQQLQQQIKERKIAEQKLQLANQELEKLATIDGLTQIPNRRTFDQSLSQAWKQLERTQQPLSLIIFDVDYFKNYNDHYSHQAGDQCLIDVSKATETVTKRSGDLVSRYGGEEFAVILPNTDTSGASRVAGRIHQAIYRLSIPHEHSQVSDRISISSGIATLIPTSTTAPTDLIAQADQALYQAKRQGRDQYHVYA